MARDHKKILDKLEITTAVQKVGSDTMTKYELGLLAGTPVGTSLIDAHAGGVGVMESLPETDPEAKGNDNEAICHRMVLVCGTSTCHMAVSQDKLFIPGVWGPFWSESMMHEMPCPFIAALTEDLHVLPDFHGNRSPIADPKAKGVVFGFILDTNEKQLTRLYLATMQAIAYGTRYIVEHCNANGHKIDTVLACGGLSKNTLFIQEHADIIGLLPYPRESESVLLGAAILGAVAAEKYTCLNETMKALTACLVRQ
ncbi:hypothetical protein CRYUN_Cryun11dG0044700 [Craigia yunnanensis]